MLLTAPRPAPRMPNFFFRRRPHGASDPSKPSSARTPLAPRLFSSCHCDAVPHTPLRVFCIPCVFVVPPPQCACHCPAPLNHPHPEPPNTSPLHVSASTTLTPAAASPPNPSAPSRQAPRTAEQPAASHRRQPAPAAHTASDPHPRPALAPSSFLHDLNANMTVVLNLTDSSHPLQPPTFAAEPHLHAGRAPTAVQPTISFNPPRSEPEPSSYSSSESRDLLDEDSDITEETLYDSLVKQLQQTSPDSFSRALQAVKAPDLSADARNKLITALENALRTLCIKSDGASVLHSNVRMEAYTTLASFYASAASPQNDKVIDYCQSGLDLAAGRERLFPQLVANLHALKARVLVNAADKSRIPEAISHAKAAQVALYAVKDPKLQYQVCVTLGDAHTFLIDSTTCDNIRMACEWYSSAIQLSKMAALESPIKVMWLTCRVAQLTLRFLRQKRSGESARDNDSYAAKRDTGMANMTIPHLINMVEQLRVDVEKLRESDLGEVSDQLRQLESVVAEYTGKAYLEKARMSSCKTQDLRKAASSLQKALLLCSWNSDPAGQRYAGIQETLDDVKAQIKAAEAISSQDRRR